MGSLKLQVSRYSVMDDNVSIGVIVPAGDGWAFVSSALDHVIKADSPEAALAAGQAALCGYRRCRS